MVWASTAKKIQATEGPGQHQRVEDLTVGQVGFGWVRWEGTTEVDRALLGALAAVVRFGPCWVEVYPRQGPWRKPARGQGLNRPATIALHGCWPEGNARRSLFSFIARLRATPDTRFRDYCPKCGTWTFEVDHFTRYGLPIPARPTLSDDDDDEQPEEGDRSTDALNFPPDDGATDNWDQSAANEANEGEMGITYSDLWDQGEENLGEHYGESEEEQENADEEGDEHFITVVVL